MNTEKIEELRRAINGLHSKADALRARRGWWRNFREVRALRHSAAMLQAEIERLQDDERRVLAGS